MKHTTGFLSLAAFAAIGSSMAVSVAAAEGNEMLYADTTHYGSQLESGQQAVLLASGEAADEASTCTSGSGGMSGCGGVSGNGGGGG